MDEIMLVINKTAIAFDEKELMKLGEILTDQGEIQTFGFLERAVYCKIAKLPGIEVCLRQYKSLTNALTLS